MEKKGQERKIDRKEQEKVKKFNILAQRPPVFHWRILSESRKSQKWKRGKSQDRKMIEDL